MIKELLSFVSAPVTQLIENWGEKSKAKHLRDMAVIQNQARLAADKQSNNAEWELASLKEAGKFLRVFSFSQFSIPIFITVIWPEHGAQIFLNLGSVPDWYIKAYLAMNGAIWGIIELKTVGPAAIRNIASAMKGAKGGV